jgi:hypothetical protein
MQSQPRRIRLDSGEVIDAEDLPSAAVRAPPPLPAAKTLVTAPEGPDQGWSRLIKFAIKR